MPQALLLLLCILQTLDSMNVPPGVSLHVITKPASDEREYIGLTTQNGVRVLLISDPTTDKSAVALNAGVGAMHENKQFNGVAHLVEHMVYMGSEKYPKHDEFSKYMENHGGNSNAYTDFRSTVYQFDISPNYFPHAFDLFAHAFIKPLFTESALESEINAVNQEHEKNLAVDGWRYWQLALSAMNKQHPLAHFCTGNFYTLKTLPEKANISTGFLVRDFYDRMYSSNLMNLVVLSKESLQELIDLVVPLVNKIQNKNIKLQPVSPDPLENACRGKLYKFVPVKESHRLSILWTIPEMIKDYRSTPFRIFSKLIQGSQEGSLLEYLQHLGWAESLGVSEIVSVPGCTIAEITFSLSSVGIDHWEEIAGLLFQYLNLFRGGIDRWRFEEYQKIFKTNFDYTEKSEPWEYVTDIVDMLPLYDMEDAVSGNVLMHDIRPDLVQRIVDSLQPSLCSIFVSSQKFADIVTMKEPWYGTKYLEEQIPFALIKKWEECETQSGLYLPPANPFIPGELKLLDHDKAIEYPALIMKNPFVRLYYKQDTVYKRPRAYVLLSIISSDRYWDKEIAVAYSIYSHLIHMSLRRAFALARRCDYILEVKSMVDNLAIIYGGYDDKLDKLSEIVADNIFAVNCTEKEFDLVKDSDLREYRNLPLQKQTRLAAIEFGHLMRRRRFRHAELLPYAEALTFERFMELQPRILEHVAVDALIFGNIKENKSKEIMDIVQQRLTKIRPNSVPLPEEHRHINRETYLPAGKTFSRAVKSYAHPANGVLVRYQMVPFILPEYVYGMLFVEVFEETAFDTLRTKEHLGYIAGVTFANYQQSYFVSFYVQSDRDANYVHSRILAFVRAAGEQLRSMSEESFAEHVESLLSRITEKPKNMLIQATRWFDELTNEQILFNRRELIADVLRKVTKQDLINFYEKYLSPDAAEKRRLTVFVRPDDSVSVELSEQMSKQSLVNENIIADEETEKDEEILDANEWINSMPTVSHDVFHK